MTMSTLYSNSAARASQKGVCNRFVTVSSDSPIDASCCTVEPSFVTGLSPIWQTIYRIFGPKRLQTGYRIRAGIRSRTPLYEKIANLVTVSRASFVRRPRPIKRETVTVTKL